MTGHRLAVLVVAVVALGSATGVARTRTGRAKAGSTVGRFAALTFGKEGGRAALGPAPAPEAVGTAVDGRCQVAASNTTFTEYCTPNGWLLRPAGTQVDTQRAPTGVTVSPNAKTVVAVNSGIFDEQISLVDTSTLAKTNEFTSDLYMGAAIDG